MMMAAHAHAAWDALRANAAQVIAWRRWLHQHPEESLKEYKTADYIERQLSAMGLNSQRVGDTGVYAHIKGALPGPVTVLRADIDALKVQDEKDVPYRSQHAGFSHSCGHDMHTAALLAVAEYFSRHQRQLKGELRFFFQQAEEIGAGARQFIAAGLLAGAQRVYGLHADSSLQAGQVAIVPGVNNASCDAFSVVIKGKSAHVSTPHMGVDALYIASLFVTALQGLVTRLTDPVEPVIIGVGRLSAGSAYNALAAEAQLMGTTRYVNESTRKLINGKVTSLAHSLAEQYGGQAEVSFQHYAPVLMNDEALCEELALRFQGLPGISIIRQRPPKLAADDFAEFLQAIPGAYLYVGTHNPDDPNTGLAHHNGSFDVDEGALVNAAALLAQIAADRHL